MGRALIRDSHKILRFNKPDDLAPFLLFVITRYVISKQ